MLPLYSNQKHQDNAPRLIVLILLGLSLLLGLIMGGVIFFRLSYFWGGLFFFSWIWFSKASKGVFIKRTIRTSRAQVGHIFEEQYDIHNNSYFPIFWLEINDDSPLPSSDQAYILNLLRGRKTRSFLLRTRLTKRGVYQLGPISLSYGDIFGIFHGNRKYSDKATLIVYPILYEISEFPIPPGLLSGGDDTRRRTHQITPNAAGVREYAPGDPLNRIHWLNSARRNRLMVKEFELDPSADIWLFIDTYSDTHHEFSQDGIDEPIQNFWDWLPFTELPAHSVPYVSNEPRSSQKTIILQPSTLEYCASIGASLANYYLKRGKAVGMASMSKLPNILPPDRSGRQLGKILEAFALLKADGDIPLYGWAETQARHLSRGSILILITPSNQPEITYLIDWLGHLGLHPIVILINSETFGGSSGSYQLYDNIKYLGYPVILINKDENLKDALSTRL